MRANGYSDAFRVFPQSVKANAGCNTVGTDHGHNRSNAYTFIIHELIYISWRSSICNIRNDQSFEMREMNTSNRVIGKQANSDFSIEEKVTYDNCNVF
jgi:hypothetical protein